MTVTAVVDGFTATAKVTGMTVSGVNVPCATVSIELLINSFSYFSLANRPEQWKYYLSLKWIIPFYVRRVTLSNLTRYRASGLRYIQKMKQKGESTDTKKDWIDRLGSNLWISLMFYVRVGTNIVINCVHSEIFSLFKQLELRNSILQFNTRDLNLKMDLLSCF